MLKDYTGLIKIIENFDIKGDIFNIDVINSGIINNTYVISVNDNGKIVKYLLQKVNTRAFKEPFKLMKNIENVTKYIKDNDKDSKEVISVIKTKDNSPLYVDEDLFSHKEYYRIYNYIDDTISYDVSKNNMVVFNAGKAFGHFGKILRNYPIDMLEDTIENFHNTKKRYESFIESCRLDSVSRYKFAKEETDEIVKRRGVCSSITGLLDANMIPYRVTHNDTKVNNVLMDPKTGEPVAVIDLDTVMKGSGLYDYGDGVRSAASTASEDETDLSKVSINMELFKAYTDGYLSEMAPYLNELEVNNMANSIRVITLELAIRFLDDYLNKDTYFKTNYENHNLDRARNQLKLVKDIESKMSIMEEYIKKSYNKYNNAKVKIKK